MADEKILIVEDDRIVADDIQSSLKNMGYTVSAIVASGAEALVKVKEDNPDLVLMDIVLKGEMNGIDAADRIRSQFNIPVVYLTAYADEELVERAKITEPFGYIIKPFEDRELKTAIEIALYKHKMEKKLKDSEEWFSTTMRSIGDALIATDTKGYVTLMNPVAESLTGWSQEEAKGNPLGDVFSIINEETREKVENPVTKVIREGRIVGLANHTVLIARDGTEIPIDDSGAPITDQKGEIIGVVLVFRDITERRQAEEALQKAHDELELRVKERTAELAKANEQMKEEIDQRKQTEETLRSTELWMKNIFNSLDETVLVVTPDRKLVNINDTAEIMFGYSKEELKDHSTEVLHVDHEHYVEFGKAIKEAFDQDKTANFEFELKRKNGEIFPTDHTVSLLKNDQGEPLGIVSVVRDNTERKQAADALQDAHEQLVRQEKLAVLGQLAGGVGHEMRNPLGAIRNAAYFLNMTLKDPEQGVKDAIGILEREVLTSERIISSLLDFARPEPPTRINVDINEVVRTALSRAPVPENVEIKSHLDETLPTVVADPDQLNQAFGNFILNAIQAMSEGGRLVVKSETPSPELVTVSFIDTGIGIAEEKLGRVFEPLFTTKAKGIGLGLALTKIIVEGNEGTIEVESKVGEGTTFTVRLPVR